MGPTNSEPTQSREWWSKPLKLKTLSEMQRKKFAGLPEVGLKYDKKCKNLPTVRAGVDLGEKKESTFLQKPYLKEVYSNTVNEFHRLVTDPSNRGVPFIIAKTRDEGKLIADDRLHWMRNTYPSFIPCFPSRKKRMPFAGPDMAYTKEKNSASIFGHTLNKLALDTKTFVLSSHMHESKDAFFIEEMLQQYAGYSWCVLNQVVGAGDAKATDDAFNNHFVVIHFFHGIGNLMSQGLLIPNPCCQLAMILGQIRPCQWKEYQEKWTKEMVSLCANGDAGTPKTILSNHAKYTLLGTSDAEFFDVSLDVFWDEVRPLLQWRQEAMNNIKQHPFMNYRCQMAHKQTVARLEREITRITGKTSHDTPNRLKRIKDQLEFKKRKFGLTDAGVKKYDLLQAELRRAKILARRSKTFDKCDEWSFEQSRIEEEIRVLTTKNKNSKNSD